MAEGFKGRGQGGGGGGGGLSKQFLENFNN